MPAKQNADGTVEKESNNIINIILLVLGALFVIQGILLVLSLFNIAVPQWIQDIVGASEEVAALLGGSGLVSIVLGVWCFIGAIGLFREQEWGWGQILVVTSIIIVNSIGTILGWINGVPFDVAVITNWITIIGFAVAVVVFVYLLATKKRFY
jgi:hypothetical protein